MQAVVVLLSFGPGFKSGPDLHCSKHRQKLRAVCWFGLVGEVAAPLTRCERATRHSTSIISICKGALGHPHSALIHSRRPGAFAPQRGFPVGQGNLPADTGSRPRGPHQPCSVLLCLCIRIQPGIKKAEAGRSFDLLHTKFLL